MNSVFLLLLLVIPFGGAIIGALLPDAKMAKGWALAVCLATAVAAVVLALQFNFHQDLGSLPVQQRMAKANESVQLQFGANPATNLMQFQAAGTNFHLGVDAISLWLVLLTVLLQPLAVAASFGSIKERQKEYYAWMLALLGAMLGVFVARDVLLFYIFFELTLIPMFFIIGIWGGPDRRYAAGKFFLYTFTGSVFTLAVVIYLGMAAGSFDILEVVRYAQLSLTVTERHWVLLGLLAGFAVKVPLFPVHTWLPLAHTEAPTAGSVILAGVLLKLGTYGLLRLALPMGLISADGVAATTAVQIIGALCVIGILYGALVAWVQQDIKKLVAYSSVSHLGFCVLGLAALNDIGMQGSVLYMINHGLSTGALFLCIGMIYDRYHTRDINELSGLAKIMPKLAFFFVLFAMSSIGLPGLNGFASEFLTILGAFTSTHLGIGFGVLAALGVILGAVYMLHMLARVVWGPLKVPAVDHGHGHTDSGTATGQADQGQGASPGHGHAPAMNDINGREIAILIPLAIAVIVLGVIPTAIMKPMLAPVQLINQPIAQITPVVAPTPRPRRTPRNVSLNTNTRTPTLAAAVGQ